MNRIAACSAAVLLLCPFSAAFGQIMIQARLATTRGIGLSWAGTEDKSFRIERRTGEQDWTPIESGGVDQSVIDRKIEPYATYQYRIVAGFRISNVITVGPPPAGFSTIVPRPGEHPDTALGRFISPVLDSNGDPAAAFVYADPRGTGRNNDTQLMFVAWNRATYRWKEPVVVAAMGPFDPRPPAPCISITRDAQTGTYGIAWVDPDNKRVKLAISRDAGVTWSVEDLLTGSRPVSGPSLAFFGGKAFFSVALEDRGTLEYMTGGTDDEPSSWKSETAPMLPGNNGVLRGSSLALDGKGVPALAYWQRLNNSNFCTLTFWRPGGAQPVKVVDTGASGYAPDGVILAFAGTQPRMVLDSRLDRSRIVSHYSVFSNDGGVTWSRPVAIPDDGNEHMGGYMSFAVSADGREAFAGDVAGGTTDRMQCPWPKLSRTADLASWTTCAPQGAQRGSVIGQNGSTGGQHGSGVGQHGPTGGQSGPTGAQYKDIRTLWGSVIYSPGGMLYLLFQNRQTNPAQSLPAGLMIWNGR
jgi:hypothetical protein